MMACSPDMILRGSDGPVTCLTFYRYKQPHSDIKASTSPSAHTSFSTDTPQSSGWMKPEPGGAQFLLSGSQGGTVHVWSMKTRRIIVRVAAHRSSVLYIECGECGEIFTQGRDGTVHRWTVDEEALVWTKIGSYPSSSLTFCPAILLHINKLILATPSNDSSTIDLVNVDSTPPCQPIGSLRPVSDKPAGMVMCISVLNGNACRETEHDVEVSRCVRLFAGYEDGSVCVWNISDSSHSLYNISQLHHCTTLHHEPVAALQVSTSALGSSVSVDGVVSLWRFCEDRLTPLCSETLKIGATSVCLRSDARLIVVGCTDGTLRLFGAKRLRSLAVLRAHNESVQCVAFDRTGRFASGGKDHVISLWSLYQQQ